MDGKKGTQDIWGVGFGSGSYIELGLNRPFHNLHNCMVACTTHERHSGTSLLWGTSDSKVTSPPAASGLS